MLDPEAVAKDALVVADAGLDVAWNTGVGLQDALAIARGARLQAGDDPVIEDAKLAVAEKFSCTPSAAFDLLVWNSEHGDHDIVQLAHDVLSDGADFSLPDE